jgi:hypothetical protein
MRNTANVTDGKPIAVLLQSISGVSAINPLIAFYDIHIYFIPTFIFVNKVITQPSYRQCFEYCYNKFKTRKVKRRWGKLKLLAA